MKNKGGSVLRKLYLVLSLVLFVNLFYLAWSGLYIVKATHNVALGLFIASLIVVDVDFALALFNVGIGASRIWLWGFSQPTNMIDKKQKRNKKDEYNATQPAAEMWAVMLKWFVPIAAIILVIFYFSLIFIAYLK